MLSWKLRPPRLPPDFVPRPRVPERLTEGSGRRLPPTIQLVIASRDAPPLGVAVLRGRRDLAEVGPDDLRFDPAEVGAFLQGRPGAPLDQRLVADTVDRSDGWAAGLRLMTLFG